MESSQITWNTLLNNPYFEEEIIREFRKLFKFSENEIQHIKICDMQPIQYLQENFSLSMLIFKKRKI